MCLVASGEEIADLWLACCHGLKQANNEAQT